MLHYNVLVHLWLFIAFCDISFWYYCSFWVTETFLVQNGCIITASFLKLWAVAKDSEREGMNKMLSNRIFHIFHEKNASTLTKRITKYLPILKSSTYLITTYRTDNLLCTIVLDMQR